MCTDGLIRSHMQYRILCFLNQALSFLLWRSYYHNPFNLSNPSKLIGLVCIGGLKPLLARVGHDLAAPDHRMVVTYIHIPLFYHDICVRLGKFIELTNVCHDL